MVAFHEFWRARTVCKLVWEDTHYDYEGERYQAAQAEMDNKLAAYNKLARGK